jgi:SAM-dependent methyltransferase
MSPWPPWHCPEHSHPLVERSGSLQCPAGHDIPCKNGIPRFVAGSTYADHFGAQWNRHRTIQLDSHNGRSYSRDRLRRCLGEALFQDLANKQVLECGCGAGRFTEVLLGLDACVTSVDLSSAVDANVRNCPLGPSHRVAQADIRKLPFAGQSFDVVFCLGVIQHTPDPEQTIACLYRHVAPGGALVIDHYAFTLGWYTKTAPLFRAWLKRLPPEKSFRIVESLVGRLLPWHRRVSGVPVARSILHRLSPVLSYYDVYPELEPDLQRELSLLDTHDYLTDWYKHFRTPGQVRAELEKLGLEQIWCEPGGNGVEARGRRPEGNRPGLSRPER